MRNKALLTFLIFFIFFIFVASAAVASAGTETQLTHGERLTQRTAIFGNYVFWTETTGNDVHAFDLTTGKRTDIDGHAAHSQINSYGNKVLWTGDDGDSVYMYDVSTGNETKITSGGRLPDIYGNYVVYANNYYDDQDHQNDGIYLYDLNTNKETKIATVYSSPAINDMKVVWSQANSNNAYDVRLYDISTNQTSTLTTTNSSISESELDIYGNVVVWTESGNVYMYDIASHKTTQVTNSGNASQPAIYGNRIVYTICDNGDIYSPGHCDIYMYEISTARTTRVTTSISAFGPSIYGDKIVYADSRNNPEFGEIREIYLYNLNPENETLKAVFIADVASGNAPLNVSFTDISSGIPNTWYWDFGDDTNSTQQNPTHIYSAIGKYTALLRVSDANGTDSMSATINVLKPVPLVANFSTNVSKGHVPLSIQFTDLSENAKFWYWDFGDGTFDSTVSTQQNPVHTYLAAGNYTVTLAASDYNSTDYKSATIIISGQSELLVFPVADFSSSLVSGYAPLDVQFTDASQNATEQSWDFGDGSTSTEQNPAHTYFAAGTYLVRLVASNVNVTDSKTATINILENNSSSSESSSGAGGGAGGSPEPAKNVEVKELSQTFVSSGKSVKFDFPRNATSVVYVSFDSKKTTGKTTTIVEMLKGKSTLVSELPSGEVYKSLNIWVGNGGFATGNNIENPVVCFKVEKAWAHDKKIDKSSIILNRYNYKRWNQLPTSLSGEDDKYLYFTAKTPGFSTFAITGEIKAIGTETKPSTENKTQSAVDYTQNKSTTESTATTVEQIPEQKKSLNNSKKESTKTPGFEIASGIVCLLGLFLYKRR